MLCNNCGKNEANVRYTQIINGVKNEMHLCEKCANKLGINFNMSMSFSNIFEDMFEDSTFFIPNLVRTRALLNDAYARNFENSIRSINNEIFGDVDEYDTFDNGMNTLLKRINQKRNNKNKSCESIEDNENIKKKTNMEGKIEKNKEKEKTKEEKISLLKNRLEKEIKEERYEDAAKTRDEIRKLEK